MRIEIVTYRNPDGPTELSAFADGEPVDVVWTDVDPGSCPRSVGEWQASLNADVADASPKAAAAITSNYAQGANTEYVVPADQLEALL